MNALRRVLLSFWGLVSAGVAILMAIMLLNSSVAETVVSFVDNYFLYNLELVFLYESGIWLAILFGLLLLAFGLFCVIIALMPKATVKKLRVATIDGGAVDIGLSALENMVRKSASAIAGISAIEPKLMVKNNGLHIDLRLTLAQGISVPEIGNAVSTEVKSQLEAMAGIIPAEVKVVITDIAERKEGENNNGN